jgi:hypothetical protein
MDVMARLDDDGQVYLGLFLDDHAFIWDGKSPVMEVSAGGMGEPVTDTVPMGETNSIAMAVLCMKVMARLYVEGEH